MNFDRLRFVAERAEVGEAREALFGVTIPERPGAFREFCATIGRRVVTEFNYRLSGRREAHIFVGIATQSRQGAVELTTLLQSRGYPTIDLTDDEMAKLHIRYMVGGRSAGRRQRTALSLRVSRAAGRAHGFSRSPRRPLEHQPVPLPQSRVGFRSCARRLRGARRRCRRLRGVPRSHWGTFTSARATTGRTRCSWGATTANEVRRLRRRFRADLEWRCGCRPAGPPAP